MKVGDIVIHRIEWAVPGLERTNQTMLDAGGPLWKIMTAKGQDDFYDCESVADIGVLGYFYSGEVRLYSEWCEDNAITEGSEASA